MVESRLPPGFRFHPRDEELVCDYLMKKVTSSESSFFIEVDLNKCEPWDIPGELAHPPSISPLSFLSSSSSSYILLIFHQPYLF